GPPGPPG
nr:Chain A, COLLAGEN TRIPLE HELIX [synthetic construct]